MGTRPMFVHIYNSHPGGRLPHGCIHIYGYYCHTISSPKVKSIQRSGTEVIRRPYTHCSNDDPRLNLICFTALSNLDIYTFI